ncbi:MAG: ankyrin repeat domain-containing protein [Gammaproteobacteria bacterium]|nr:ankyrin repeat domain-containing protein [Gammaproteobacteria bacterium]MCW5583903.1 ankyrin repeat domain-containing protein [Gammaproteobacteria bacterium]
MADIITLMTELSFPTNVEGVCWGLALMAERARRCGQYSVFKQRMNFLSALKDNELKKLLEAAKDHDRALRLKRPNVEPLTCNEKILLTTEAFFFQVWAHFDPSAIQDFLGQRDIHFSYYDTRKLEELMYDVGSHDKEISPLTLPHTYFFCITEKNARLLRSFLREIMISKLSIGITINSMHHAVHLFHENRRWYLTNHSVLTNYWSIDGFLLPLIRMFSENKVANLTFRVFMEEGPENKILLQKLKKINHDLLQDLCNSDQLNLCDSREGTLLDIAAREGGLEVVRQLSTQQHMKIDYAPLLLAAKGGHVEIVKELLAHLNIIRVEQIARNSLPLLRVVAENGHLAVMKELLKYRDVSQILEDKGYTLLYVAAEKGRIGIVTELLGHLDITQINQAVERNFTSLHIAARNGHVEVVEALLQQKGIIVANPYDNGCTPLYLAAENGHAGVVEKLLPHLQARQVNQLNKRAYGSLWFTALLNPLQIAARNGHVSVVEVLLRKEGIDIDQRTKRGTALQLAVHRGHAKVVEKLLPYLKAGQINQTDSAGDTLLYVAAGAGHLAVVKTLLKHEDIAVDQPNGFGGTPLIAAAYSGHMEIVRELLEYSRAKLDQMNEGGITLLSLVTREGYAEVMKVLLANKGLCDTAILTSGTASHETLNRTKSSTL